MMKHKIAHRLKQKQQAEALVRSNRLQEAYAIYQQICSKSHYDSGSLVALSVVCRKLGLLQEAEQSARQVLARQPDNADALHALGATLHRQKKIDDAIACYRDALKNNPGGVETHYFLANALREQGAMLKAEKEYQHTLVLQPDHVEALNNLSALLTNRGKVQRAVELAQRALQLRPDSPQMLINLGRACLHAGNASEAEAAFRRVTNLHHRLADAHSNLLACLNYLPDRDPHSVFNDHRLWGKRHASSVQPYTAWGNKPDVKRRLRIGYVSPDFREHSVSRFLESVFSHHNKEQFEVLCYSDVQKPDATTMRLRGLSTHWCDTHGLSCGQFAECVRKDNIDILVDLAGHTANNRLLTFIRKPAPVQVTWLGYPNTTGISAMDYRIVDILTDPPGLTDAFNTETLIRLPRSFLCYQGTSDAPKTGLPPSMRGEGITFGCFNNLAKVTNEVIRVWSRILNAVADSRILFKSRATGDPGTRQWFMDMFYEAGVDRERVQFMAPVLSHHGHLAAYNQIDVALDTFPYNGATTTCEALWMGVPVITLAGEVHAARVGVSLLSQVGLGDLVAADEDVYVSTAVQLSEDTDRLKHIRNHLRETTAHSSLCDSKGFTKDLERTYQQIWFDWCQAQSADA